MFNKRKSLLLGILAAATATGLALGVNGVVDAYVGEPVEVSAASSVATFSSDDVVSNSGYQAYSNDDWGVTFGGNNKSIGTNKKNRSNCNLTNYSRFAVSPLTASATPSAFYNKVTLEIITSIEVSYSAGSNFSKALGYLIYSDNNQDFELVDLNASGVQQGDSIGSANQVYSFEFSTSLSGYFAFIFADSGTSGDFRIDYVVADFYQGASVSKPDDAKPVSVTLDIGTGKNSFAQGEDFDPTGYSITVEYASDSEPDYGDSEVIDGTDERLTWQFNSDEIGETDLSVTFNDGKNEPVVSNVVKIEITKPVIYDYLTASTLGLADTYQNFNGKSFDSKASYSGNAMKSSEGEIQIRNADDKDPSGIVVTSSDKNAVSINVSFRKNLASRILEVYGSNTPYTSINDLYGSNPGKLIYEFKTDDGDTQFAKLSGEYKYLGIRSAGNAIYINSIEIGYEDDSSDASSAAVEFANLFLSEPLCNDGVTAPDVDTWDLLGLYFEEISADSKEIFNTAVADVSGTEVEQCVARYDYIVGKYSAEKYNDFMGRNPAPIASALSIHNSDEAMDVAIISALAVAGIAAAGAFVFLRRKKEA